MFLQDTFVKNTNLLGKIILMNNFCVLYISLLSIDSIMPISIKEHKFSFCLDLVIVC